MIAYFSASVAAKQQYIENYQKIIKSLQGMGTNVIYEHIINSSEEKIRLHTKEERYSFHEKVEKWIQKCDFMVVETSHPSISVGYEIALALRIGKPVLLLYSLGDPPSLLGQHKNERLVCEKYDLKNVTQILKNFIGYVQGKHDLRFTFFITPEIVSFLDDVTKTKKVPKSVYIRQLIEKEMEKSS
jgi:phosphoenolpyruvate carboxylase